MRNRQDTSRSKPLHEQIFGPIRPWMVVAAVVALWFVLAAKSPVPAGSRFLTSVRGGKGVRGEAVFELLGRTAMDRARKAAEAAGYEVVHADDSLITMDRGDKMIRIRRGRYRQMSYFPGAGSEAELDEKSDGAVIELFEPEPQVSGFWRWIAFR